jgi:hypothetical protein
MKSSSVAHALGSVVAETTRSEIAVVLTPRHVSLSITFLGHLVRRETVRRDSHANVTAKPNLTRENAGLEIFLGPLGCGLVVVNLGYVVVVITTVAVSGFGLDVSVQARDNLPIVAVVIPLETVLVRQDESVIPNEANEHGGRLVGLGLVSIAVGHRYRVVLSGRCVKFTPKGVMPFRAYRRMAQATNAVKIMDQNKHCTVRRSTVLPPGQGGECRKHCLR